MTVKIFISLIQDKHEKAILKDFFFYQEEQTNKIFGEVLWTHKL